MIKTKEIIKKYNEASILEKLFKFEKAKELFLYLLKLANGIENKKLKAGIYFHLGCIERKLGNEKSAIRYFKKCLEFEPNHRKASLYINIPEFKGLQPVSNVYGIDRGTPIDRYYIEKFLKMNRTCIKGDVLEILNRKYTELFGGERVFRSDILDIDRNNKFATIYADLRKLKELPENKYDCIILTQTIHVIDDVFGVVRGVYKMLKKKGIVLATLPALSRIDVAAGMNGDYWRFTQASAKYLFESTFEKGKIEIQSFGNVYVGAAFLYGYSHEEIPLEYLEYNDKNFPLIITVKAEK